MPLHSMVAPAEQRRVFMRPPVGVRKIVMATNIGAGCGGVGGRGGIVLASLVTGCPGI